MAGPISTFRLRQIFALDATKVRLPPGAELVLDHFAQNNVSLNVPTDLQMAQRILEKESDSLRHYIDERVRLRAEVAYREALLSQLEVLIASSSAHIKALDAIVAGEPEDPCQ